MSRRGRHAAGACALGRGDVVGLLGMAQPLAFGVAEALVAFPFLHALGHGASAGVLVVEPGDAPLFGRHVGPFKDAAAGTLALSLGQLLHPVGKGQPRALLGHGPGVPFGGERREDLLLGFVQIFPAGLEQCGDGDGQLQRQDLAGGQLHGVVAGPVLGKRDVDAWQGQQVGGRLPLGRRRGNLRVLSLGGDGWRGQHEGGPGGQGKQGGTNGHALTHGGLSGCVPMRRCASCRPAGGRQSRCRCRQTAARRRSASRCRHRPAG